MFGHLLGWLPWFVGSAISLFGIAWVVTFLGFAQWLAPLVAAVLLVASRVLGSMLSTRTGVAVLVAAVVLLVVYPVALYRGETEIKTEWALADLKAEEAAAARDARVKADAEAAVKAQNDFLSRVNSDLQQKVQAYEAELAKRPKSAACVLGRDDVRKLLPLAGTSKPVNRRP